MSLHKTLKQLPPLDLIRYLCRYDSETGRFYRRNLTYSRKLKRQVYTNSWRETFAHVEFKGYGQYHRHRIMWALHYGEDPYPYVIDHINRDHEDNRITNLRKVTPTENSSNREWKHRMNVQSKKPVRITYPDGRGTIVVDSLITAGRILSRSPGSLSRTISNGGDIYWDNRFKPTGIRVEWHT